MKEFSHPDVAEKTCCDLNQAIKDHCHCAQRMEGGLQKHEGKIWFETEPGHATTFFICLAVSIRGQPTSLVQDVALHHCPSQAIESAFSALTAVHCADALVHVAPDASPAVDTAWLDRLGLTQRVSVWRNLPGEIRATA